MFRNEPALEERQQVRDRHDSGAIDVGDRVAREPSGEIDEQIRDVGLTRITAELAQASERPTPRFGESCQISWAVAAGAMATTGAMIEAANRRALIA